MGNSLFRTKKIESILSEGGDDPHGGGGLSRVLSVRDLIFFGIAAILGSGNQVISWIHIEDICRLYVYAIENNISGIFNAVAAKPVTNKSLTLQLAKKVRGRSFIPVHVPSFVLKIILGEMSIEVLKSATVSNSKIKDAGFQFLFPSIEAALNDLEKNV